MNYEKIPKSTLDSLKMYVAQGTPTGGFLRAVLSNNLQESFGRADDYNREAMFEMVCYIYNEIPSIAHGSPERVDKWISHRGWEGYGKNTSNLWK